MRGNTMRGLLVVVACLCSTVTLARAETIWPTPSWQTSSPEEQGMDSAALAKVLAFGKTRSFDSLLVVRHGRLVLDAYYAPYSADIPHAINSSTKAVVGNLVSIALKDGLLDSLDHPVLDFFHDRPIENVDDRKKAITVQNLLDMTSGLDWDEGIGDGPNQSLTDLGRSADWIKFILDRPMAHAPGEVFYYDSGNPHLLSGILLKLTGMRAEQYAKAKLFGPLGIDNLFWRRDPQGISTGGFGLYLLPRDMAKLGYLYLHQGEWAGKQLLPADWFDRVQHTTLSMNASFDPSLRYKNFYWVLSDRHVYMTVGYHCQVIMMVPDHDVVAVMTARNFCPFGKMADLISAAVRSDSALPPDQSAADQLAHEIADISTEQPSEVAPAPALAAAISGKTYSFPRSDLNIRSLTLSLAGSDPHYRVELYEPVLGSFAGPIGLDGRYRKGQPSPFGVPAAKGTWSDDHTFAVDFRYVGSGDQRSWTLSFDDSRLTLKGKTRDGREVSVTSQPD
jgi:CubicO group peptidase (beta-lactamase class C family)